MNVQMSDSQVDLLAREILEKLADAYAGFSGYGANEIGAAAMARLRAGHVGERDFPRLAKALALRWDDRWANTAPRDHEYRRVRASAARAFVSWRKAEAARAAASRPQKPGGIRRMMSSV